MATSSSFLLDTSRRILFSSEGATVNVGGDKIPASLFGEISPECLKGIGFTFKEEFESGHKKLEDSVDSVFKPVTTALNALLKALPIGGGVSINGADDLRAKALEALVLLKTANGDSNANISSVLEDFNYVYSTNIPMRKAAPHLDMKMGSSLKIEFAYGKCNLFDAQKEVWEPLMNIKSNLFPAVKAAAGVGLLKADHYAKVPFTTQSFPVIAKVIIEKLESKSSAKSSMGKMAGDLTKAVKEMEASGAGSGNILEKIQNAIALSRSGTPKSDMKYVNEVVKNIDSTSSVYNWASAMKTGFSVSYEYENWQGNMKNGSETKSMQEFLTKYAESDDPAAKSKIDNALEKFGKDNGTIISKAEAETYDPASLYFYESGKIKYRNSNNLTPDEKKAIQEKNKGLENILTSLAKIKSEIVGMAVDELSSDAKAASRTFYFGFPACYVNSLKSVKDTCTSEAAKVTLLNVIPTDVSISFDFSNLDENNYPMAGTLEIKNVWSLGVGGSSLALG